MFTKMMLTETNIPASVSIKSEKLWNSSDLVISAVLLLCKVYNSFQGLSLDRIKFLTQLSDQWEKQADKTVKNWTDCSIEDTYLMQLLPPVKNFTNLYFPL